MTTTIEAIIAAIVAAATEAEHNQPGAPSATTGRDHRMTSTSPTPTKFQRMDSLLRDARSTVLVLGHYQNDSCATVRMAGWLRDALGEIATILDEINHPEPADGTTSPAHPAPQQERPTA